MSSPLHRIVVEELSFQVYEAELGLLFCEDYLDVDGSIFHLGLLHGLRTMAATLTGDRSLLTPVPPLPNEPAIHSC